LLDRDPRGDRVGERAGIPVGFDPVGETLLVSAGGGSVYLHSNTPLPDGLFDTLNLPLTTSIQQFVSAAMSDPGLVSFLGSIPARGSPAW